ncbi:MAG: glycerophosphodiester phosphodiesterase [Bacillota bacterium]
MVRRASRPALHCDPARLRAERGRPLILGHRGLPGALVENRVEGFLAALAAGADGVELDVQLAADGVPVVIHDSGLERTTGRPGRVADVGSGELARLGVPRLETVLDVLPTEAVLNVEIKDFTPRDRGLERSVVALVKVRKAEGRVLFSSFNPLALARLRRLDPALYAAQLTAPGYLRALRLGYLRRPNAVHPHLSELTPARLAAWRRRGRRVIAWGADTEKGLAEALAWDLDGIITDRPAEAVRLAVGPPG